MLIKIQAFSFTLKNFQLSENPNLINDRKYGSSKHYKKVIFDEIKNLFRMLRKVENKNKTKKIFLFKIFYS